MANSITRPFSGQTLDQEFTPSKALRSALAIAGRGKPVFPCRHAPDKAPLTGRGGFHKATTDPRLIHAYWNRHRGASIGVPTGERSGFFVLDVDRMEALSELPGELPETLTARTPRGGRHVFFRHVEGITNRTGALPDGLDVRGEGGYVLVAPSPGYTLQTRAEVAEAPEWLLEMVQKKPEPSARIAQASLDPEGPAIPDGTRHNTLKSIAGGIFTGDVGQLEADLAAINEKRCDPPLARTEITAMARWFFGKETCGKRQEHDPEVEEVLDAAGEYWYEELLRGGGRSKTRDVYRALEIRAARFGSITAVMTVGKEESRAVTWADSFREIAEAAQTSVASAHRAIGHLQKVGAVRVSRTGKSRGERSELLIIDPARNRNNQAISSYREAIDACYTFARSPRPDRLETPIYRYRGHVGNAKGGVQAALEAYGPQTPAELAERLGLSRARDLVRRHLEPMSALGLVEDRGDGTWALCGDHRKRADQVRAAPFVTISRRRRHRVDGDRVVRWVEETICDASEFRRSEMTRERHEKERQQFKDRLAREAEVESVVFNELPEASPEQLAEARLRFAERQHRRRIRRADGFIVELQRVEDDVIRSESDVFDLAREMLGSGEVVA